MKVCERGAYDWHNWRNKGIGASDTPILIGVSPWKTPYQLWEEKKGIRSYPISNWATLRGQDLEAVARADYELIQDIDCPPALVEHDTYPFIRASLDGFNEQKSIVLEIKCPGIKDHTLAVEGKIPEKYYWQVQHQLLASGAAEGHYYSFDGKKGILLIVYPSDEAFEKIFNCCLEFWDRVQTNRPPSMVSKDFKRVLRTSECFKLLKQMQAMVGAEKPIDEQFKELVLSHLPDDRPGAKIDNFWAFKSPERELNFGFGPFPGETE